MFLANGLTVAPEESIMQQNHASRLTFIACVLVVALLLIFPPASLFNPDLTFTQKLNLKPGIDMVGGTSLTYEIKPPQGQIAQSDLAERVMDALKKRVDPDGVRNLVWRPQGGNRLEIQMPHTQESGNAAELRRAFSEAEKSLESTNLRASAVLRAVETLSGDVRAEEINRLAGTHTARAELFGSLRSAWDRVQEAKSRADAEAQAQAEIEYDDLKSKLGQDNLTSSRLQSILDNPDKAAREKNVDELKTQFAGFPERLAAIDLFSKAYADFAGVRGTLDDAQDLKRLLKGSGVLEFHILVSDWSQTDAAAMVRRLTEQGTRPQQGDVMQWFEVDKIEQFKGPTQEYNGKHYTLCWTDANRSMTNRPGATAAWALDRAYATPDETGASMIVGFTFNTAGAARFSELTSKNIGSPLAILLDDRVISAPNIQTTIGASGTITGDYTKAELNYMVSTLNAGSLPARLADEPIMERTVGPQLGKDNLTRGFASCVFGLFVVAVFLIGYYYLAGVVATFAVAMNMVLILGAMAMLNATFTLAGVAGIVLTIGMAVDANVLIFERLREEQLRGLSLKMALRNAYDRAFTAIFDSNVTTGITALVLYWIGSEEVKGFGLTLLLGIVSSMFTSLFVTKTLFSFLIDKVGVEKLGSLPLTFPKWDRLLKPKIDWMAKAKYFYAFSIVFLAIGLAAFFVRLSQGKMLDIEFAPGTSVQFELKEPMQRAQVDSLLTEYSNANEAKLPSPSVVAIGTTGLADRTFEVITPNPNATVVREAILTALEGKLNVQMPSRFERQELTPEEALAAGSIVPIKTITQEIAGFVPSSAQEHVGGAAIVLNNLQPALSASEVRKRVETQRLQAGADTSFRNFDVESPAGTDAPSATLIVLTSDASFAYDNDSLKQSQWVEEVALPMWRIAVEAVTRPPTLQKVTSFTPQVAGQTRVDASIALTLSIFAIVAYIWVRFGDLKYGTATVVALIHDTLFTLAAIGVAHYLANSAIGEALLIEPFRINLTLVAAVLTVMGYSMNDTVVVFDRIRENRGKFGAANRQVINDSINQTLSRTLLTGGTTLITIFVMYIFGGAGIHGFTFALLVGILVGTYSSLAIAAPLLLLGGLRQASTTGGASVRAITQAGA